MTKLELIAMLTIGELKDVPNDADIFIRQDDVSFQYSSLENVSYNSVKFSDPNEKDLNATIKVITLTD